MRPSALAVDRTDKDALLDTNRLEDRALYCYEQSLSVRVSNEHTVQFRGEARELAYQILSRDPDHADALNLLGRIALDEGFYDSAEHYLNRALAISGDNAGYWYSLGHLNLATGQYEKAIQNFTRSLDLAPNETRAATSLVYTFAKQGNVVQAFNGYRQLFRVHPADAHIRAKLFEVARFISADHYQPDLEQDVITWLKLDNVDHNGMAPLTTSLLSHKYHIREDDAVIDLQDLAQDELFKLALTRLSFSNADLERFMILVRKQILLHSLAGQFQDSALLRLASAFALQATYNEHVYALDDEEKALVQGLKDLLETTLTQPSPSIPDLISALLMYGMYEPLHSLQGIEKLAGIPVRRWPSHARRLIRNGLIDRLNELDEASRIERLTPIRDGVSREVQRQYEENPYPRWLHLNYNTPTNYGRALEAELNGFRAPQFFNMGTIRILIAGAGTGRHALHVAKYFRNVEVTAIDLSTRSLAYAKRMAERYRIHNIRFLQADILELPALEERYHVIECSGVLHHMEDPEAGLATLIPKLEPSGLIKLGLYSRTARRLISSARDWIDTLGYRPTVPDIRRFRDLLLNDRLEGSFDPLLSSSDFYTTSGCRDLLFHIQEHRFTPLELNDMLERHRLEFLGFVLPATVKRQFTQEQGAAASLKSLFDWQAFEQRHPDVFASMYQFYVQPMPVS